MSELIGWRTMEREHYVLLEFQLAGPIRPEALREVNPPRIYGKPLVISGRGPIWFYAFLVHHYAHLVPWLAVYDPKLGGAVVVVSHDPAKRPGDIVKVEG